jgi:hypothetical protein
MTVSSISVLVCLTPSCHFHGFRSGRACRSRINLSAATSFLSGTFVRAARRQASEMLLRMGCELALVVRVRVGEEGCSSFATRARRFDGWGGEAVEEGLLIALSSLTMGARRPDRLSTGDEIRLIALSCLTMGARRPDRLGTGNENRLIGLSSFTMGARRFDGWGTGAGTTSVEGR